MKKVIRETNNHQYYQLQKPVKHIILHHHLLNPFLKNLTYVDLKQTGEHSQINKQKTNTHNIYYIPPLSLTHTHT